MSFQTTPPEWPAYMLFIWVPESDTIDISFRVYIERIWEPGDEATPIHQNCNYAT